MRLSVAISAAFAAVISLGSSGSAQAQSAPELLRRPIVLRGSVGVTPSINMEDRATTLHAVYPSGKVELEGGVTFSRLALGLTAVAQLVTPPNYGVEAGLRLSRDFWLRPWVAFTPSLLVGGAWFRSIDGDDGWTSGRGLTVQVGVRVRFRSARYPWVGIAVNVASVDVLYWWVDRGIWYTSGYVERTDQRSAVRFDLLGAAVTF